MEKNAAVLIPCDSYETETLDAAMWQLTDRLGGLDWVKPGMRIGIKLNLCGGFKPERAATTHPAAAAALTRLLTARGASVVWGDAPGEPFSPLVVGRIYHTCRLEEPCTASGGELNRNYESQTVQYPEAKVLKQFTLASWIAQCDAVISFCKLKAHGLVSMTAAVKNTFGIIPGTLKSELHFRYSDRADFADLLVDLNEYLKPVWYLCDAVEIMEGNGPTQGTPRHLGVLTGGTDPYRLDRLHAWLLGVEESALTYLEAAKRRGLLPAEGGPDSREAAEAYRLTDFVRSGATSSWFLPDPQDSKIRRTLKDGLSLLLRSDPALGEGCVGCGHCRDLCPAGAIRIEKDKAKIKRSKCVHCFCCQEFCPTGAMKVRRSFIARLIQKE